MKNAIFVTGTDTGVGKTVITGLLGRFLAEKNINVITQKWVQTGCSGESEDIREHLSLMKSTLDLEKYYNDMVPYVLKFPSSPHLAASLENIDIDTDKIKRSFRCLADNFDFVIVEGSGGLMVPVNAEEVIVDIAEQIGLSALIVAENKLGAINHTLLTVKALQQKKIPIVGIVFNRLKNTEEEVICKDNKQIIEKLSGEEVLGELPYHEDFEILYGKFVPIGEKIKKLLPKYTL